MSIAGNRMAAGPGWRVDDLVCTAGPGDRPFQERHEWSSVAIVMEGSFQYRSSDGGAVLGPGALLLGNHGACFECGHEHAAGDRCLSFQFAPEEMETIAAAAPGARRNGVAPPRLPPARVRLPGRAAAEAARAARDAEALEEIAFRLAGAALSAGSADAQRRAPPSRRDERRITAALRRIERSADERLSLGALAREAAMSPYHFLRTFRAVVGMTPHQYVLRMRLHRAAVRLRRSADAVSASAYDAGFNDLSTFNRRFREIVGLSPTAYRASRSCR